MLMTVVAWYSSFSKVDRQFSIGIPKGELLALKCSKTQIHEIYLKLPRKVLTVNLGHYKLETMSEQYKALISAKRIFF